MITITADFSGIRNALDALAKDPLPSRVADIAENKMLKEIHSRAPSKTGKYRSSFKRVKSYKQGMRLETPYGELMGFLEFTGTQAHVIVPVKAKVLHWLDPETGQHMFRYRVRHPGTRPSPHLRPALRKVAPSAVNEAMLELKRRHPWIR